VPKHTVHADAERNKAKYIGKYFSRLREFDHVIAPHEECDPVTLREFGMEGLERLVA
jgi:hypothetical protein